MSKFQTMCKINKQIFTIHYLANNHFGAKCFKRQNKIVNEFEKLCLSLQQLRTTLIWQ